MFQTYGTVKSARTIATVVGVIAGLFFAAGTRLFLEAPFFGVVAATFTYGIFLQTQMQSRLRFEPRLRRPMRWFPDWAAEYEKSYGADERSRQYKLSFKLFAGSVALFFLALNGFAWLRKG